jgi:hypothetical protein
MRLNLTLLLLATVLSSTLFAQDIYDPKKVTEIKLYFKNPNWKQSLDSLKDEKQEERLRADMVLNGVKYPGVGVRYKGNSSYANVRKSGQVKLPLNIKVNHSDRAKKLPGGYTTLKLSNGFRDPSMIREVLAYEIARNYMPAPKANFAKVYINDELLGLYTNAESIDGPFLDRFFGDHDGSTIKADPNWDLKKPQKCPEGDKCSLNYLGEDTLCYRYLYEYSSPQAAQDLIKLTRTLQRSANELPKLMDVDQALWLLAFNNVMLNLDSYIGAFSQNYYLYLDSLGGFHPLIWDLNLAFGGFRLMGGNKRLSNDDMKNLHLFVHYKEQNEKRPLVTKLLANNLYRKMYLAHCRTIYRDYLENGLYLQRAKEWQTFIAPHLKEDKYKLYPEKAFVSSLTESFDASGESIPGLQPLMDGRRDFLKATPYLFFDDASISKVQHNKQGNKVKINIQASGAQQVWVFWRKGGVGLFQEQAALKIAEGVYELELDAGIQYYVVAEGERSAAVSPVKAGMELYKAM